MAKVDRIDEGEPSTPLGALAARMFDIAPESVKSIVLLRDDQTGEFITAHSRYDDSRDALTDLIIHLQAVSAAVGLKLDFMSMDKEGVMRVEGFDPEENQ